MTNIASRQPEQQPHQRDLDSDAKPKWWTKSEWRTITRWAIAGIAIGLLIFICRFYVNGDKNTEIAIAGILGIVTIFIYSGQWRAMRDGLDKTQDLIEQNDHIVREMRAQREIAATQTAQTGLQLTSSRNQTIEMIGQRDVMIEQLAAMKEQITLAVKQVDIQTVADRAYLDLSSVRAYTENGYILVVFDCGNSGNTPAYDVHFQISASLDEPIRPVWTPAIHTVSSVYIPAKGIPKQITINTGILENDWYANMRDHRPVFADGEYRYIDASGKKQYFRFGYAFGELGVQAERYHHPYQPDNEEEPNVE